MDGPKDYHTKWSKSDREIQILYDITYSGISIKMMQMNLSTTQKQTHRNKNKHDYQRVKECNDKPKHGIKFL